LPQLLCPILLLLALSCLHASTPGFYGGQNAHLFRRNFFLKFELLCNSFCAFEVRAASFDVFLDAQKKLRQNVTCRNFFYFSGATTFFFSPIFLLHT
jgi:hypothetical protein